MAGRRLQKPWTLQIDYQAAPMRGVRTTTPGVGRGLLFDTSFSHADRRTDKIRNLARPYFAGASTPGEGDLSLITGTGYSFVSTPYGVGLKLSPTTYYGSNNANAYLTGVTNNWTTQCIFAVRVTTGTDHQIVFNVGADSGGWGVDIDNSNTHLKILFNNVAFLDTGIVLNLGQFYNFVFYRDNGTTKAELDGVDVGLSSGSTPNSPANRVSIGANDSNNGGRPFDGTVVCCRFWDRVLSLQERKRLSVRPWELNYKSTYNVFPLFSPSVTNTKSLDASMNTFSVTFTKQTNKALTAAMATFSATLNSPATFFRAFTAAMDSFSAVLNKRFPVNLTAAMSTFSATLTAALAIQKVLTAAMSQFAATLVRLPGKGLAAAMSTFAATLSAIRIPAGFSQVFNVSMDNFSGTLTKQTDKNLSVSMANFAATLTLIVHHGGVPPICTPVACPNNPELISHLEVCDNPGS